VATPGTPEGRDAGVPGVPGVGQRLPALDGLRGVAILMVLLHQLLARRASNLIDIGWIGVTLFFVLSGFLITHLLLALQGQPGVLRAFYVRRALRIVPLAWLMVLVMFVLLPGLGLPSVSDPPDHAAWYLLFLANWAQVLHLGGTELPSFWSLGVEEQFYLLWPALLAGRSARAVLGLSLAVAAAGVAARAAMVALGAAPEGIYVNTFARMDALAAGAALAAALRLPSAADWLRRHRRRLAGAALALALIGLLATHGFPRLRPIGQTLGYTLQTLIFTLGLAAALGADLGADLGTSASALHARWLRSFGQYSYAIYVFHHPLHMLAGPRLRDALGAAGLDGLPLALAYIAAGTALLWALGWLSWRLIERPLRAWRPDYPALARPA
jgi:peptidoglycan/LPS O-acetylase OafA/YrhL